jgi:hypothetical protein
MFVCLFDSDLWMTKKILHSRAKVTIRIRTTRTIRTIHMCKRRGGRVNRRICPQNKCAPSQCVTMVVHKSITDRYRTQF